MDEVLSKFALRILRDSNCHEISISGLTAQSESIVPFDKVILAVKRYFVAAYFPSKFNQSCDDSGTPYMGQNIEEYTHIHRITS